MPTPEAKAAREKRLTRRINIVMYVVLGMFAGLIALSPAVVNASSNSNSSVRTDEIAACRSVANSDLNEARTAKSEAARLEDRAQNRLEEARVQVTEVAIFDRDNEARLVELRATLAKTRLDLEAAERVTDLATAEERKQNDIYRELSRLSLEDPDAFLNGCKR